MNEAGVVADMIGSTSPENINGGGEGEDEGALVAAVGDGGGGQSQATQ